MPAGRLVTPSGQAEVAQVRVLLVDDHALVREAIARVLDDVEGLEVCGQASGGEDALRQAAAMQPDVVVLDYSMPEMDGLATTERLQRQVPAARVLVLTVHDNVHYVLRVLEAGALGFVVKSAAVSELVEAIRAVAAGEAYISPVISRRLATHVRTGRAEQGVESLSAREFELLRLLGAGRSVQDCARRMHVSESTASTYRARIMGKLELESTAAIIRYAIEHGLVE